MWLYIGISNGEILMKRKLLAAVLICSIVVRLTAAEEVFDAAHLATLGSSLKPDHITLTWTGDPSDSQTITFRTSAGVKSGAIIFNEKAQSPSASNKMAAFPVKLESKWSSKGQGSCILWSTQLKGLKPATTYQYSIKADGPVTGLFNFTTGPAPTGTVNFSFLVFGDSQSGNASKPDYSLWHDTISNAFAQNHDARFFVNMGDLVEIGGDYSHWNNWFTAAQCVMEHIPTMPVQGNHETYGGSKKSGPAKPSNFISQFPLPQDGPDGLKGQCYSYDYGAVHFAVIDSQEKEESSINGPILQKQADWLAKNLATSSNTFKIVMFHKTPYCSKPGREVESAALTKILCPVIEGNNVDVVFNGHDHVVARTHPIGKNQTDPGKGPGTIYYIAGRSGSKAYSDVSKQPWAAFFHNPKDQPCYLVVNIHDRTLTIRTFKADGTLLDTYIIDKT